MVYFRTKLFCFFYCTEFEHDLYQTGIRSRLRKIKVPTFLGAYAFIKYVRRIVSVAVI